MMITHSYDNEMKKRELSFSVNATHQETNTLPDWNDIITPLRFPTWPTRSHSCVIFYHEVFKIKAMIQNQGHVGKRYVIWRAFS